MSGYKFQNSEENAESAPDLAQHAEFHFKDKDVEEKIEQLRHERLEQEEREWQERHARAAAGLTEPTEDDSSSPSLHVAFEAPPAPAYADEWLGEQEPSQPQLKIGPPKMTPPVAPSTPSAEIAPQTPPQRIVPSIPAPGAAPPAPAQPTPVPLTPGQATQATPVTATPTPQVTIPKIGAQPQATPGAPTAAQRPASQAATGSAPPTAAPPTAAPPTAAGPTSASPSSAAGPKIPSPMPPVNAPTEDVVIKVAEQSRPTWRVWLDKLDPVASLVASVSFVLGIAALTYIVWGIYGGQIGDPASPRAATNAQNVALAGRLLKACVIAGAISSVLLMLDVPFLGATMAAIGFGLHFGATPLLRSVGNSQAVLSLIETTRSIGFALFIIGLLKAVFDVVQWALERPARMMAAADIGRGQQAEAKQLRVAAEATMLSPCWGLPFCRETVRVKCPAFLAKSRCWKFGRGCLCDQEMVARIMRNDTIEQIKAPTSMSKRKPPCNRCQIFLHHQMLKYKVISPLAIPATVILAFMGWPLYKTVWSVGGDRLSSLWQKLSFAAVTNTPAAPSDMDQYQLSPQQVASVAQNLFGFILAFFLLIYLSKFIEWAIFKARL